MTDRLLTRETAVAALRLLRARHEAAVWAALPAALAAALVPRRGARVGGAHW